MYNPHLISATLVYDGRDLTKPYGARDDQFKGTTLEDLAEYAGRICYDSVGSGRSSEEFHKHILEVRHLSIYRHCNVTIEMTLNGSARLYTVLIQLLNRPGVFVHRADSKKVVITINLQSAIEWGSGSWIAESSLNSLDNLRHPIVVAAAKVAPTLFRQNMVANCIKGLEHENSLVRSVDVWPEYIWEGGHVDQESIWYSFLIRCSRNCSHEFVRHNHRCAVSQRSTRYCDETNSSPVWHPLLNEDFVNSVPVKFAPAIYQSLGSREPFYTYEGIEKLLEGYLISKGNDAITARKQARGAARGVLPSCLGTEFLFSASIAQWKRMIEQRMTDAADAEIRVLFGKILAEFKQSRHKDLFDYFEPEPAKDGIGERVIT